MLAGEKLPCSMRHFLRLLIFPQAMNNLNMIIRLGMYLRSKLPAPHIQGIKSDTYQHHFFKN